MPKRSKHRRRREGTGGAPAPPAKREGTPCPECGGRNPSTAVFCRQCGRSLTEASPARWHGWLGLLVAAAAFAAYSNSFDKAFVFDDEKQIVENQRLRDLGDLSAVLGRRRPVTDLTLALNYHFHGLEVGGYHVINLTIHVLAGLTFFGIVRRTLLLPGLRRRFAPAAPWLALAVATIWAVHPLQTQSVTYIIQRAESLMGLFYLLTVYCVLRGTGSARAWAWYAGAVVACGLGMGSKAVMVTAPIVVLLYDRVYLSRSWGELLRRRGLVHLGLAATWGVLLYTRVAPQVLSPANKIATVGFGVQATSPWEYLLTQAGVILHYLRLSLWPNSLCLDYGWIAPVAREGETVAIDWARVAGPGALVGFFLLVTLVWLIRRPQLGFVAAWFFLILAPTSSIVPIKDPIFEHRMYLPLAAVVVLSVLFVYGLLHDATERLAARAGARRAVAGALCLAVIGPLVYAALRRNEAYRDDYTMWLDVVSKRPENARAFLGLGAFLQREALGDRTKINTEQLKKAEAAFRQAVALNPNYGEAHYNLGNSLFEQGRYAEAVRAYQRSLECRRVSPKLEYNLANAYKKLGDDEKAIEHYRMAIKRDPGHNKARVNLANTLRDIGRPDEAVAIYRDALELEPGYFMAWFNLGVARAQTFQYAEALAAFDHALAIDPEHRHAPKVRRLRERVLEKLPQDAGG